MTDKSQPLVRILQEISAGWREEFELLGRLVESHINNPKRELYENLALLSSLDVVINDLHQLAMRTFMKR